MQRPPPVYSASPSPSSCLRQGELICNLFELRKAPPSESSDEGRVQFYEHPYAVVISQDCDLEQDWRARTTPGKGAEIASILLCDLETASVTKATVKKTDTWNSLQRNNLVRYQFLQKVDPSCDAQQIGIEEMVADFKQYFTIPTSEAYEQLRDGSAKRRSVLVSPYLEHLCVRFAQYLSRVALPQNHASDP